MKTRLLKLFALLALTAALIPAGSAFASSPKEYYFYGTILSLPKTPGWIGNWKVGGRTVHVSTATLIDQTDGAVAKGAKVLVEGYKFKDGSINATSIDVNPSPALGKVLVTPGKELRLFGTIRALPRTPGWIGDWKVGGRKVHVSTSTIIDQTDGAVAKGVKVLVEGFRLKDGSINAISIDVLAPHP
jgi:hypothetical protein